MFQIDPSWFQIPPWLIVLVVISTVAFSAIAIVWGIRAHHHQASAGREELIGKTAEVLTAMDPKGTVFIQGERWTAISETGWVEPEKEVIITRVKGLTLYVLKKE